MAHPRPKAPAPPSIKAQLLSDHCPELGRMIRAYSLIRFGAIARLKEPKIVEHEALDAYLYGSHQAMILVAAKDIKITFKAHFNVRDIRIPGLKPYAPSTGREPQRMVIDFFREYANLTAGGIKHQLQNLSIICGVSLPIVARGFDEMIFSDVVKRSRLYDYWRIVFPGGEFTCTAQVDVFDDEKLKGFMFAGTDSVTDEGTLEFL